jgi:hypothetical protein
MDDPGLACLRLRGLPFAVTRDVLLEFFNDYTVRDLLLACTDGEFFLDGSLCSRLPGRWRLANSAEPRTTWACA